MRPTNLDKAMTARLYGVVRCLSSTIGAAGSRRSRGIHTRILGRRRCGAWAADCASETRLERFFVLPSLLTEVWSQSAPRWFSTIAGWPHSSASFGLMARAIKSGPTPAKRFDQAHGLGRIVLCERSTEVVRSAHGQQHGESRQRKELTNHHAS